MTHTKKLLLSSAIIAGLLPVAAQAQYTNTSTTTNVSAPATPGTVHNQWEAEAGIGYLADTNIDGADDGVTFHLGAYYLDPANSTKEMILKYGGEFIYGNASSSDAGDPELNTYTVFANGGVGYRFSEHFEGSIIGGVGVGGATFDRFNDSSSTFLFGFQIKPELTAWITDRVGVSLAYRFLQTVAINDDWRNPREQSIEFSVKFRF